MLGEPVTLFDNTMLVKDVFLGCTEVMFVWLYWISFHVIVIIKLIV